MSILSKEVMGEIFWTIEQFIFGFGFPIECREEPAAEACNTLLDLYSQLLYSSLTILTFMIEEFADCNSAQYSSSTTIDNFRIPLIHPVLLPKSQSPRRICLKRIFYAKCIFCLILFRIFSRWIDTRGAFVKNQGTVCDRRRRVYFRPGQWRSDLFSAKDNNKK